MRKNDYIVCESIYGYNKNVQKKCIEKKKCVNEKCKNIAKDVEKSGKEYNNLFKKKLKCKKNDTCINKYESKFELVRKEWLKNMKLLKICEKKKCNKLEKELKSMANSISNKVKNNYFQIPKF